MPSIDPLSCVPLHVQSLAGGKPISNATAFVLQRGTQPFLITNWHVVTGRDPIDQTQVVARPDGLLVWHHGTTLGHWGSVPMPLIDSNGARQWLEHPNGSAVDVVALPVQKTDNIALYPMDLGLADTDLMVSPSDPVSIVGFPYGQSVSAKLPIWKTGHVASDIEIDFNGTPSFLIDATTRSGMSGSPVIARRTGIHQKKNGDSQLGASATRFLGIYSGRVQLPRSDHPDRIEVGQVWRPEVLHAILGKPS